MSIYVSCEQKGGHHFRKHMALLRKAERLTTRTINMTLLRRAEEMAKLQTLLTPREN